MNYKDTNVHFRKLNYPTLKPGPNPPIPAPQVTHYKLVGTLHYLIFFIHTHSNELS